MNKRMIVPAVLLFLSAATPLHADYGRMKEALSAYSPPDFFPSRTGSEAAGDGRMANEMLTFEDVQEELAEAVGHRENTGIDLKNILIGLGLDKNQVVRLAGISASDEKVTDLIARQTAPDDIKILAALRNPAVTAAQKQLLGELRSYDQVTNLEDMLRQYASFARSLNSKAGPVMAKDSVKMAYPLPGLASLKGRLVDSRVEILAEKTAIAVKTAMLDTQKAFWDLVFVKDSQRITRETIGAFKRLGEVAAVLYKSGKTSFQDVLKINIKIEELQEDLKTLDEKERNIHVRLAELLNLPAGIRINNPKTVGLPPAAPGPKALYAFAREHRQELKIIRRQVQKLELMVEMGETMVELPFTLGLSYADSGLVNTTGTGAPRAGFAHKTMAGMKNGAAAGAWFGTNEPWLAQTRQTLAAKRQILVRQENATDRMIRNAWFKLDKARREYLLNHDRILPLAKSALDVSTKEYETGAIPFSQAIGSYTDWLTVKLAIAKKKTQAGIYFAELEAITGKTI